jgi:G:T-mismatch repair DNA endonuclease (very short patch repair protein)
MTTDDGRLTPRDIARLRAEQRRAVDRAIARHRAGRASAGTRATRVPARAFNRLEAKLARRLDEAGVDYQWQFRLGRFVYDFLLPGRRLVEVHGTYWHADPRFHPDDSLTPAQRRNRVHDLRKRMHAADQGYRYVPVWEHDIEQGTVRVEDLAGGEGRRQKAEQ